MTELSDSALNLADGGSSFVHEWSAVTSGFTYLPQCRQTPVVSDLPDIFPSDAVFLSLNISPHHLTPPHCSFLQRLNNKNMCLSPPPPNLLHPNNEWKKRNICSFLLKWFIQMFEDVWQAKYQHILKQWYLQRYRVLMSPLERSLIKIVSVPNKEPAFRHTQAGPALPSTPPPPRLFFFFLLENTWNLSCEADGSRKCNLKTVI